MFKLMFLLAGRDICLPVFYCLYITSIFVKFSRGLVDLVVGYFNIKLLTLRVGLACLLYDLIFKAYSVKSARVSLFFWDVLDFTVFALSNLGYYIFSFSYQYFSYSAT